MSKTKKKRNKAYHGTGAKANPTTIHRYQAIQRSKLGQWWFDHKKLYKPITIGVVIIIFLVWIIVSFLTSF